MASEFPPIEITTMPDLLALAEEVQKSKRPRLLRHANETIAVLMPAAPLLNRTRRSPTPADIDAAWAAFGMWNDEDTEMFLRHNEESRRRSMHPPVEL